MLQELEIVKAKDGVTADQLRSVLKYGEQLVGEDYDLVYCRQLRQFFFRECLSYIDQIKIKK